MTAVATDRVTLTLSRDALASAVAACAAIVRRGSSLAVLKTVRWDGASLTATDLDVFVTTFLPGEPDPSWPVVCLPGAVLSDVVRGMRKGEVSIAWNDREATITSGGDRFTLPGMQADEFPSLPTVDGPSFTLSSAVLLSALAAVRHAVATSEAESNSRPAFCGVHLRERNGVLVVEATQGHRLAQIADLGPAPKGLTAILPAVTVDRLLALLPTTGDGPVVCTFEPAGASFEVAGAWRVGTRLIEYPFAPVDHVVPVREGGTTLQLDPVEWDAALARAAVFAPENHRVEIRFTNGRALIQASDKERGKGQVGAAYTAMRGTESQHVAINVGYLRDLLKALPADADGNLTVWIGGNRKPIRFDGRDGCMGVIVPLVMEA